MISVEEAKNRILEEIKELSTENKNILDSLGQVIAEDIIAPFDVPAYRNSSMDGFAVLWKDIRNASDKEPSFLKVIGEIPAGHYQDYKLKQGECIRIMTGGIVPPGIDTVVPVELTDIESRENNKIDEIGILQGIPEGSNIRNAGEDIHKGEPVMKKGDVIRPAEIGVMASLGIKIIKVIRRPRVAIIATGNEVVDIKEELPPGKLYNSNSYSLAALVIQYGGMPTILGVARDNIDETSNLIERGLEYDLIVTSGGVSVGEYDLVKKVLETKGKISFWRVRMKPGKPVTFGMLDNHKGGTVPLLGLPGNPVSCMLAFEIFGKSIMAKMMGKKDTTESIIQAIMENTVVNNDGRRIYSRVHIEKKGGRYYAQLTGNQSSGVLTSMVRANGLAIIPETVEKVEKGDIVDVMIIA